MAGIGFELRKHLHKDTFTGTLKAYGYAGIISSGPWVLSIIGIMVVGIVSVNMNMTPETVMQFLISVTWMMASSLIVTGLIQLLFTRFISDRLFENKDDIVLPNLIGVLILTTVVCAFSAILFLWLFFPEQGLLYRLLMLSSFVTLCNIWVVTVFSSGMKQYQLLLIAFFIGYVIIVIASVIFQSYGLNGLLMAFLLGHGVLLFFVLGIILREYPGSSFVRFDFMVRKKIFLRLAFIGLFYNLGIWLDKIMFWLNPATSEQVIGPLRASIIYDLPIFLAYLSILPGMAVFLVKIETDFVETYDAFYNAVRDGDALQNIESLRNQMVLSIREAFYQIFKIQGVTVLIMIQLGPLLISMLELPPAYVHLYYIDVAAVAVQVMFLSILNVLFYLDKLSISFWLTFLLVITNAVFTGISFYLGPVWFGYGFAASITIVTLLGLYLLTRELNRLEYVTFMLQK